MMGMWEVKVWGLEFIHCLTAWALLAWELVRDWFLEWPLVFLFWERRD